MPIYLLRPNYTKHASKVTVTELPTDDKNWVETFSVDSEKER